MEPTLPSVGQYKTHVPIKVTNVQLLSPQVLATPFSGLGDDNAFAHEAMLKGRRAIVSTLLSHVYFLLLHFSIFTLLFTRT